MGRFAGLVTHRTVSNKNFQKMMSMPFDEIERWSNVKVEIVENSNKLYSKMARSIADAVAVNNKAAKISKIILPVGPTPQYKILADIFNREKINLKYLWIFFMDEYLDWQGRLIPESYVMSFRGFMKKNLFSSLDKGLGLDTNQVIWPNPNNLDYNDNKIEELGGIDVCYGGIGYHGHIAFNEPYDTYYRRMTVKKFLNSKTRIIDLNSDTFVINSLCGVGGNSYDLPPKAVTIGMRSIINAKRIELYCDGGDLRWQRATFRIACMHPPTLSYPSTLLQLHKDPKNNVIITADKLTALPIKVSPK